MPEILVLCSAADVPALWLARALTALGETVTVLTVEELAAARIQHRIEGAGTSFVVDRADGTRLEAAGVDLVVNRVVDPPAIPRALVSAADRELRRAGDLGGHARVAGGVRGVWLPGGQPAGARAAWAAGIGATWSGGRWRSGPAFPSLPAAVAGRWAVGPVAASVVVVGDAVVGARHAARGASIAASGAGAGSPRRPGSRCSVSPSRRTPPVRRSSMSTSGPISTSPAALWPRRSAPWPGPRPTSGQDRSCDPGRRHTLGAPRRAGARRRRRRSAFPSRSSTSARRSRRGSTSTSTPRASRLVTSISPAARSSSRT